MVNFNQAGAVARGHRRMILQRTTVVLSLEPHRAPQLCSFSLFVSRDLRFIYSPGLCHLDPGAGTLGLYPRKNMV